MLYGRSLLVGAAYALACASPFVLWSTSAPAQGPVYRERWGYLHLENRRAELFAELAPASGDELQAIARLCAEPDQGVPFVPIARALARVRGVEADAAFVLRSMISAYVLPEVVDPEAEKDVGHSANFTIFLPFTVPERGELAFDLLVRDRAGETVWQQSLTHDTAVADLRMARPDASMPAAELTDGAYELEVRTLVDGQPPRAFDPTLRWTFHVLRGYQARSEKAIVAARTDREQLEPLPRALLDGLALQVARAYGGEAFAVRSDAVRQLEQLESALSNLANHRPVLAGLSGGVVTALPAGDYVQPCLLRLSGDHDSPRPLVVFATGTPAYDTGARRPTAPVMRESAWLDRELGDFGTAEGWRIASIDSPGGGRPFGKTLVKVLTALREVMPTGGTRPLLVCDREAAAVVAVHLAEIAPHLAGVVLVGAGAIPNSIVGRVSDLPVRMVALQDYPASSAVDRMIDYVDSLRRSGQSAPDLARLHERHLPWLFGVPLSRVELLAFGRSVFRDG